MSGFVSTLTTPVKEYYHDIPKGWQKACFKSLVIGFVIGTVVTLSPTAGLVAGGASAVATLVYTVVSPLFKRVLGKETLSHMEEFMRGAVSLVSGATLFVGLGLPKVISSLFIMTVLYAFRAYFAGEQHRSVYTANTMLLV